MSQMMQQNEEQVWEEYKSQIANFLDLAENRQKIEEMLSLNQTRFSINLDSLRDQDSKLYKMTINNVNKAIPIIQSQIQSLAQQDLGQSKEKKQNSLLTKTPIFRVGFEGNMGRNLITPRGLSSGMINNLVGIQGIVTKMSIVRPKLVKSAHYCENTQQGSIKEYNDEFDLSTEKQLAQSNALPLKDLEGNPLSTEFGFCQFRDIQTLLVQEMPERAPTGLLPRSVEVVLEEDLVDKVKPGDRIQVVGVYKCQNAGTTNFNGIFKSVLVACSVFGLSSEISQPQLNGDDLQNIRKLAEKENILDIVSQSLAPHIQGHDWVKKAVSLMLLGGLEKTLENGTHLRGDINIMLVGDPSTAKSQMLRRVLAIAPLAVNTTGRGSSGVGLTAAVNFDKDTGERHLEAGAMVLADRGVVCIDEFDKMNEADRVAIHEVMEQQTVTIAKAGIHTSLNARCSVIAAANPIYGEYQKDLPPTKNIGLPDSLLSRFDVLFVILDQKDPQQDRLVAEKVTRSHRYFSSQDQNAQLYNHDDDFLVEPEDEEDPKNNQVFEKNDMNQEYLTLNFLKKYLYYAKKTGQPQLTDEAIDYLAHTWTSLRAKDLDNINSTVKNLPITIRTYETLIRLSTAHAKLRLSKLVQLEDCKLAASLLNYSLFNDEDYQSEKESRVLKENTNHLNLPPKKAKQSNQKSSKLNTQKMIDQQEDFKKDSKSKKSKKLIQMDDEQLAEDIIEKEMIPSLGITELQKKSVFRGIIEMGGNQNEVNVDKLWEHINSKGDKNINSFDEMKKCLIEFEKLQKIMYFKEQNQIVML